MPSSRHGRRPACGRSGTSAPRWSRATSRSASAAPARRAWTPSTSPTADDRTPCDRSGRPAAASPRWWRTCDECDTRRTRPRRSPPDDFRISACSASVFRPILWQPPQPLYPSINATGCACAVGMALTATHAIACFPPLNCATCFSWHIAQVSGVGIFTFATSVALEWRSPWHVEQPTSFLLCLLSCQSVTMLGVAFVWQSTHTSADARAAPPHRMAAARASTARIRECMGPP